MFIKTQETTQVDVATPFSTLINFDEFKMAKSVCFNILELLKMPLISNKFHINHPFILEHISHDVFTG